MTDIKVNDVSNSGTWGEFYTNIELLSLHFANGFFDKYDLARAIVFKVDDDTKVALNKCMSNAMAHVNKQGNVHRVNHWQVGLGLVDNFKTATDEQAAEGGHDDLFITPSGYTLLAGKIFGDFEDKVHHQGINPISSYGEMGFIPPDIYGSFEGSVASSGGDTSCMMIEDDGTLVGLRYGTNGIESGLYYFYKTNAEFSIESIPPVRTNYKYYPPGIPTGLELALPRPSCDNGVLIVNLKHPDSNPNKAEYIISLTNGTLDQTKHYSTTTRLWDNQVGSITRNVMSGGLCGFLVGEWVYIVGMPNGGVSQENKTPFNTGVWRLRINDIKTKEFVLPEQVKGWSTTGYRNIKRIGDVITYADVISSPDPELHSMIHTNIGPGSPFHSGGNNFSRTNRVYLYQHPTKQNLVRVVFNTARYYVDIAGVSYGHNYYTVVVEIDVNAKTAAIINDPERHYLWRDEVTGKSTNIVKNQTNALKAYGTWRNDWNNIVMTDRGYLFCRTMNNAAEGDPSWYKGTILNFTNRFDMANPDKRDVIGNYGVADKMLVGSAITNMLSGAVIHEDGYMTLYQTPSNNNDAYFPSTDGTAGAARTRLVGSPTSFKYRSINGREDRGYNPTVDRQVIKNPAPGLIRLGCDVTSDYKYKSHSMIITSRTTNGCYERLDSHLKGYDPITWSRDEILSLARTVVEEVQPGTKVREIEGAVAISTNRAMPVMFTCVASYNNPNGLGVHAISVIAELNEPSSRKGEIKGFSVYKIINKYIQTGRSGGVYAHGGIVADFVTYQTKSGDILWALRQTASAQTPGGSDGFVYTGWKPANDKHVNTTDIMRYSSGYFRRQSMYSPIVIPGVGLSLIDGGINASYDHCAMVARVLGDNVSDLQSRNRFNETVVLASQQVEKGWLVYFTAETPLFMMGSEFTLPQTHIDLRDVVADPRNKTFHLYCRLKDQKAEYLLTTDELNPTMALMYIGDILTDDTQIKTINVDKRIRLDTFQISPTRVGSSIPVTTGVPSQVGSFAWK